MIDYLYDGTFEGLLTCIHHHYYTDKASGIFRKDEYQSSLLGGYMEVDTDMDKASIVYEAIAKKISAFDLKRVYKAYLSNDPDKEIKILRYVIRGFKEGSRISMLYGEQVVADVQSIEKKINVERERMLQFVRFSVMAKGVLYAEIEPDNDVIALVADHFCDRFKNDPFIIHDTGRKKALIAYNGQWYITDFHKGDVLEFSEEEMEYRRLWKHYFENIAIKERTNLKCQKNFMPVRYWKNLTEVNQV